MLLRPVLPVCILATVLFSVAATAGAQSEHEVFVRDVELLRDRYLALSELIPASSYGWRPDPAARSVSEVLMHVSSGTYFHMNALGVPIPRGSFRGHRDLETITEPETVALVLRQAFEHAISHLDDAEDSFSTRHNMANHLHEHLGQMIAYTRSLGLVPPWTEQEP